MATIAVFKRKFENLYGSGGEGIKAIISDEVKKTSDVILDLNRDQLLYGRNADGEILTPSILDDPYWNDKGGYKTAYSYMVNKSHRYRDFEGLMSYSRVQLFPSKSNPTPNLIHSTGSWFFNHFFINISNDSYTIGSSGLVAPDIELKFGKVYGLAPESRDFYYKNWIRVRLWAEILKYLSK